MTTKKTISMLLKDCVKEVGEVSSGSTTANTSELDCSPEPRLVDDLNSGVVDPEMDAILSVNRKSSQQSNSIDSRFSTTETDFNDDLHILAPRTAPTE